MDLGSRGTQGLASGSPLIIGMIDPRGNLAGN